MWRMLVIGLLCMQLVACSQAASKPQTKIEHAVAVCVDRKVHTSLFANNDANELHLTLIFDDFGMPESETKNQVGAHQVACILEDLGVPQRIRQQIVKSDNNQGLHTEEFGNLTISWVVAYGVRIVIREQ
jgi:hypothetical protein